MAQKTFLPVLRVSGTPYEIGFEAGRKFKSRIQTAFTQSVFWRHLREEDKVNPQWFDNIHSHAKKHFPHFLEEIEGIAVGSDLDYRDTAIINFRVTRQDEGCSTVIYKTPNKIILAQNEDHEIAYGKQSYLLIVELEDGPSYFAHTYPANIAGFSFSFNSNGIIMSANAMPDPNVQNGVPRHLLDRAMLDATSLDDALQWAQFSPRCGAFSYNLVSMNEWRAVNLETTSKNAVLTEIDKQYFHTNHYVSHEFQGIPIPRGTTLSRYERGIELLPHVERSIEGAFELLSDEKIFQSAPMRDSPLDRMVEGTLCTAVFEISSEDIFLNIFPPNATGKILQFSLNDLLR